jgi:hypothetical protein
LRALLIAGVSTALFTGFGDPTSIGAVALVSPDNRVVSKSLTCEPTVSKLLSFEFKVVPSLVIFDDCAALPFSPATIFIKSHYPHNHGNNFATVIIRFAGKFGELAKFAKLWSQLKSQDFLHQTNENHQGYQLIQLIAHLS